MNECAQSQFGPQSYWEQRARRFAREGDGLRAVCSYGMPWFYNRYIHLTQWRALRPWLKFSERVSVLEVGCGVGRWSRRMARGGATVTGIDLSPTMVAEASRRARQEGIARRCCFLVADVAELTLSNQFESIVGVTVLQHIIDDERFEAAVLRLAAHLTPGGRMVLLEAAPSRPASRCDSRTFKARQACRYLSAFERAGLHCVAIAGVDPTPLKTALLPSYARLPRPVGTMVLAGVTALSLPLDLAAAKWLVDSSWHKVFVLTR